MTSCLSAPASGGFPFPAHTSEPPHSAVSFQHQYSLFLETHLAAGPTHHCHCRSSSKPCTGWRRESQDEEGGVELRKCTHHQPGVPAPRMAKIPAPRRLAGHAVIDHLILNDFVQSLYFVAEETEAWRGLATHRKGPTAYWGLNWEQKPRFLTPLQLSGSFVLCFFL